MTAVGTHGLPVTCASCWLVRVLHPASCVMLWSTKGPPNSWGRVDSVADEVLLWYDLSWKVTPEAVPASVSYRNPGQAEWYLWEEGRGDRVSKTFIESLSQPCTRRFYLIFTSPPARWKHFPLILSIRELRGKELAWDETVASHRAWFWFHEDGGCTPCPRPESCSINLCRKDERVDRWIISNK